MGILYEKYINRKLVQALDMLTFACQVGLCRSFYLTDNFKTI